MSFLYHFRVIERDAARVSARIWITNPDVLAWGAKAVPRKPNYPGNAKFFAAILLAEQRGDADDLTKLCGDLERKAGKKEDEGLTPSLMNAVWTQVAHRIIASVNVTNVANFPAPKHAFTTPANDKARAKYDAYWAPFSAWDGASDPPDGLARFDMEITLTDARWMPSAWRPGVRGTTAYAIF